MFMASTKVNEIKQQYPAGTRVVLDKMEPNEPRPIPIGTKGTVRRVDDAGQIHCDWDNGRHLAIIPEVDEFHKLQEEGAA